MLFVEGVTLKKTSSHTIVLLSDIIIPVPSRILLVFQYDQGCIFNDR